MDSRDSQALPGMPVSIRYLYVVDSFFQFFGDLHEHPGIVEVTFLAICLQSRPGTSNISP